MKKILDLISEEVVKAFEEAGYSVMVHWQQQKPTKKLRS